MNREVGVLNLELDSLLVTLRLLTVLSSGFNAFYFLSYRALIPRRRIGALVLALVNFSFLFQSVFSGPLPGLLPSRSFALVEDLRLALLLGLLSFLASLAMTVLILRQLAYRHRR